LFIQLQPRPPAVRMDDLRRSTAGTRRYMTRAAAATAAARAASGVDPAQRPGRLSGDRVADHAQRRWWEEAHQQWIPSARERPGDEPIYVVHLAFLARAYLDDTRTILDRIGWKPPIGRGPTQLPSATRAVGARQDVTVW